MQIVEQHSHLNGLEYLWVHKESTWKEIQATIDLSSAYECAHARQAIEVELASRSQSIDDRVAVEVHIEKPVRNSTDLFAKHLALYTTYRIDVGIEILPTKKLASVDTVYYESALENLIQGGRNVPRVPLVLIGIAP